MASLFGAAATVASKPARGFAFARIALLNELLGNFGTFNAQFTTTVGIARDCECTRRPRSLSAFLDSGPGLFIACQFHARHNCAVRRERSTYVRDYSRFWVDVEA